MTGFFHERAAEIIAAYGGDPARWPADERETALATAAADPALMAARAAASSLDHDLMLWARTPVAGGDAEATAAAAMRPVRGSGRWAAGGGFAAVIAAAVLIAMPHTTPVAVPVAPAATVSDSQAFAVLFTPTPDEENSI